MSIRLDYLMATARQFANVLFSIGQAGVPALGYAGLYGRTTGAEFQVIKTPVVPANYAFTLWSLIFLLSLVYAFDQARPQKGDDPIYRKIGWLTAVAFAANTFWSLVAQKQLPLVLTGLIFLFCVAAILPACVAIFEPGVDRNRYWLPRLAIGVLAGWVSVAIFANWSVILKDWGLAALPSTDAQALMFLSGAGATAGVIVSRTAGALSYAAAVAWALVAVLIANIQVSDTPVAVGTGIWIAAIGVVTLFARRSHRQQNPLL